MTAATRVAERESLGLGPVDFRRLDDGRYRLRFDHAGIEFEIDRVRRRFEELHGEVTVRCDVAGACTIDGNIIGTSDFNFSTLRARQERARMLEQRARGNGLDWFGALEVLCQRVIHAERSGPPAVLLSEIDRPARVDDDLRVNGFSLPRRHPAILFGDGGSLKSYLALLNAGALANLGLRVGLLDWELAGEDHADRLRRLFGTSLPQVWYARCERPLAHDVDRLRRLVVDQRLEYLIFDSVGYATVGKPEDAEAALSYFQAVRQLGVLGSLHIAHISRQEGSDRKPYGSNFWHNSARATWFIKPSEHSTSDVVSIGVFERKRNLGGLRPPFAFDVTFTADRTVFQQTDLADVPDLAARISMPQRIQMMLRRGARTRADIAADLDEKPESIRRVINRGIGKGQLIRFPGPGGEEHIGLPGLPQRGQS